MTEGLLCFIDTETTGLDARIHQPYELSYWRADEDQPFTTTLPHSLEYADSFALDVGHYWKRGFRPWVDTYSQLSPAIVEALRGVTLVGANPEFDAAMILRITGAAVWHHRLINVGTVAMTLYGWDRPRGLSEVRNALIESGYEISEVDHTAEGDVRATRQMYEALIDYRDDILTRSGR